MGSEIKRRELENQAERARNVESVSEEWRGRTTTASGLVSVCQKPTSAHFYCCSSSCSSPPPTSPSSSPLPPAPPSPSLVPSFFPRCAGPTNQTPVYYLSEGSTAVWWPSWWPFFCWSRSAGSAGKG